MDQEKPETREELYRAALHGIWSFYVDCRDNDLFDGPNVPEHHTARVMLAEAVLYPERYQDGYCTDRISILKAPMPMTLAEAREKLLPVMNRRQIVWNITPCGYITGNELWESWACKMWTDRKADPIFTKSSESLADLVAEMIQAAEREVN